MSNALRTLGSIAGGAMAGQNYLDRKAASDSDRAWQGEVRGRQRADWERQDSDTAAMTDANKAAANVIGGHRTEWQKQQPGPSMDGSPVNATPFRPNEDMILDAAQARTDSLFAAGKYEAAAQQFGKDEALRAQYRQKAYQNGVTRFQSTGDPTDLIKGLDKGLNDGWTVQNVEPVQGLDGKKSFRITSLNRITGKTEDAVRSPEEIMALANRLTDHAGAAKLSFGMQLAAHKEAGEQDTTRLKATEERTTDQAKSKLKLGEISAQGLETRRNEGARGVEDRRTVKTRGAIDAAKPYTLVDGAEHFAPETQRDGSIKQVRIATNKKDAASRATNASQLNGMAVNSFGELDIGTGRKVGNSKTQALAAAAERLMTDNPGLGANEAMAQAANDLGMQAKK